MKSQNVMAMVVSIALMVIAIGIINPVPMQESHIANSTFVKRVVRVKLDSPVVAEVVKIDAKELACLQANIYFEAGNQSEKGKEAIAAVTMNRTRLRNYPPTICGVVYQRSQFSWTRLRNHTPNLKNVLESRQWLASREVAVRALSGRMEDVTDGATHYHATYVNPSWGHARRMLRVAIIGAHIFYTDTKLKLRSA